MATFEIKLPEEVKNRFKGFRSIPLEDPGAQLGHIILEHPDYLYRVRLTQTTATFFHPSYSGLDKTFTCGTSLGHIRQMQEFLLPKSIIGWSALGSVKKELDKKEPKPVPAHRYKSKYQAPKEPKPESTGPSARKLMLDMAREGKSKGEIFDFLHSHPSTEGRTPESLKAQISLNWGQVHREKQS